MTAQVIAAAEVTAGPESPGALRRLAGAFRSRRLLIGSGIIGFFALLAVIGPFFASNPNQFSRAEWQSPSAAHWLGTTQLGQDVFAQLVVSGRDTLAIGAGAGLL